MVVKAQTIEAERLYTNAEFAALEDENIELIRGKVVKKMPIGDEHVRIARRLEKAIMFFDPEDKLGLTWREATFDIAPGFMPEPDLAYIAAKRVPAVTKEFIKVIPDLAVEVHSPSDLLVSGVPKKAAQDKISDYLNFGVSWVWAINPSNRTVEIYQAGQVQPVQVLGINDELTGEPLIPGFKMKLDKLFYA